MEAHDTQTTLGNDIVCSVWKHTAVLRDGDRVTNYPEHIGAQQYGAGATSIAKDNDLPKEVVQRFIDNYYDRYQGVKEWQEQVARTVNESRVPSKYRSGNGYPVGIGHYTSITGRKYTFRQYDAPEFVDELVSFSPTQMKNYPVQGTSTGDIVPMMLGILNRKLQNNDVLRNKVLLINTIHDSVLFDCMEGMEEVAGKFIKEVLQEAPQHFYNTFQKEFDLPLKVDVEYGPSWDTMKSLTTK